MRKTGNLDPDRVDRGPMTSVAQQCAGSLVDGSSADGTWPENAADTSPSDRIRVVHVIRRAWQQKLGKAKSQRTEQAGTAPMMDDEIYRRQQVGLIHVSLDPYPLRHLTERPQIESSECDDDLDVED